MLKTYIKAQSEDWEMRDRKTSEWRAEKEDWERLNLNLIAKIWQEKSASNTPNPVSMHITFSALLPSRRLLCFLSWSSVFNTIQRKKKLWDTNVRGGNWCRMNESLWRRATLTTVGKTRLIACLQINFEDMYKIICWRRMCTHGFNDESTTRYWMMLSTLVEFAAGNNTSFPFSSSCSSGWKHR